MRLWKRCLGQGSALKININVGQFLLKIAFPNASIYIRKSKSNGFSKTLPLMSILINLIKNKYVSYNIISLEINYSIG